MMKPGNCPLSASTGKEISRRPHPSGEVQLYGVPYLDSSGKRRSGSVRGSLDDAEARRAELRRRGERIEPTGQTFAEHAWRWLRAATGVAREGERRRVGEHTAAAGPPPSRCARCVGRASIMRPERRKCRPSKSGSCRVVDSRGRCRV